MIEITTWPEDLKARVRSELHDGERLLWVGQPRPGRFARQALPIVLFGIPSTAFAIFWMAGASGMFFADGGRRANEGNPISMVFPLFGVPFLLSGLWMLTAPYRLRARALRSCYVLTDRRAIVWLAGPRKSIAIRSYVPKDLTKVRRVEYADGVGDLVFDESGPVALDTSTAGMLNAQRQGFMFIDDVREVEALLRKTLLADEA